MARKAAPESTTSLMSLKGAPITRRSPSMATEEMIVYRYPSIAGLPPVDITTEGGSVTIWQDFQGPAAENPHIMFTELLMSTRLD